MDNKTPTRETKTTRQAADDVSSRKIISFIKWINATFEHPENWPMTDQQRISYLKETFYRAKEIRDCKSFAKLELLHLIGEQ